MTWHYDSGILIACFKSVKGKPKRKLGAQSHRSNRRCQPHDSGIARCAALRGLLRDLYRSGYAEFRATKAKFRV